MIDRLLNKKGFTFPFDAYRVRVSFHSDLGKATAGDYRRLNGKCYIRLLDTLEGEDLWDTFLHEIGHLLLDLKLPKGGGTEAEAQALGSGMHQLIQALSKQS